MTSEIAPQLLADRPVLRTAIETVLKVNMYELGFTKPWTFLLQARAPFWWTTQTQAAMSTARCWTSK